jgi:hypothetical protein
VTKIDLLIDENRNDPGSTVALASSGKDSQIHRDPEEFKCNRKEFVARRISGSERALVEDQQQRCSGVLGRT